MKHINKGKLIDKDLAKRTNIAEAQINVQKITKIYIFNRK